MVLVFLAWETLGRVDQPRSRPYWAVFLAQALSSEGCLWSSGAWPASTAICGLLLVFLEDSSQSKILTEGTYLSQYVVSPSH